MSWLIGWGSKPSITVGVSAHVIRQHAAGIADVFAAAVDEN